jgi:hypothetical protein
MIVDADLVKLRRIDAVKPVRRPGKLDGAAILDDWFGGPTRTWSSQRHRHPEVLAALRGEPRRMDTSTLWPVLRDAAQARGSSG